MKKCIALLLCGVLSMSLLAGCGDSGSKDSDAQEVEKEETGDDQQQETGDSESGESEASAYDETIPFTYTSYYSVDQMNSGVDYESDPFYQYVLDRFNIDPEMWACEADGCEEKIRTWVNTESMPDLLWDVSFSFGSYYQYIDQGLLQPLPDGWETRWPNIAYITEVSGMADLLKVDGKTYGIPHSIFGLYVDMDLTHGKVNNMPIYYRKDLAKQVGMDDFGSNNVVTKSEFKTYLEKVKELQAVPTVLEGAGGCLIAAFNGFYGLPNQRAIVEEEDGFKFTPETEKDVYEEMMIEMQEWYQEGLIDTDYYAKGEADSVNNFMAGQAAALCYPASPGDIGYVRSGYVGSVENGNRDDIGVIYVTDDEGKMSATYGYNYWAVSLFNPATDEKTLERILDLTDWLCSKEGQTSIFCGIPGVDWDFDEAGEIRLSDDNAGDRQAQYSPFAYLGWCTDEFTFTGLTSSSGGEDIEADIADALALISVEQNNISNSYYESDHYVLHQSDLRDNYSFPFTSKIREIICGTDDVKSTWEAHLEEYRNLWEPFVNELNETYGY